MKRDVESLVLRRFLCAETLRPCGLGSSKDRSDDRISAHAFEDVSLPMSKHTEFVKVLISQIKWTKVISLAHRKQGQWNRDIKLFWYGTGNRF